MLRRAVLCLVLVLSVVDLGAQVRLRTTGTTFPLTISTPSPLSSVVEDIAITPFSLEAFGGTAPYVDWVVTVGSLPTGISLNKSNGQLTGTPTTAGANTFTVDVTDNVGAHDTQEYSWTIIAAGGSLDPWASTDIGTVPTAGTATLKSGEFTITGTGTTYGTADTFQYVYQATSGDKYISANVSACSTAGPYGEECGVMVRQSLTDTSAHVSCSFGDTLPQAEWRTSTSGATSSDVGTAQTTGYVRIQVYNGVPNCAYSTDGTTWSSIGISSPPTLSGTYYIGMAVDGNSLGVATAVINTVVFDTYVPPVTGTDFQGYRPHYQGFGYDTLGVYSGEDEYCIVNTRTVSGSPNWPDGGGNGDIEDCLEDAPAGCTAYTGTQAACARWVGFSVSGAFTDSDGYLIVTHPYLTIAGQTAPTGGVMIYDTAVYSKAHDVVWQHLSIRRLPTAQETFTFSIGDPNDNPNTAYMHNTVVDHLSISFGPESNDPNCCLLASATREGAQSLLIVDTIFSETLWENAAGGVAFYIATGNPGTCNVTMARNYFAHSWGRNGWFTTPCQLLAYNNYTYNPADPDTNDTNTIMGLVDDSYGGYGAANFAFVGNVMDPGPDSGSMAYSFGFSLSATAIAAGVDVYLEDNSGPGITGDPFDNQWDGALFRQYNGGGYTQSGNEGNIRSDTVPSYRVDVQAIANTGNAIRDALLGDGGATVGNVGSRPLDRDSVDTRILQDPRDSAPNNGTHFLSLSNYSGLPTITETTRAVTLPMNPTSAGDCGSMLVSGNPVARTVLMCWLENDSTYGAQRLEVFQGTP